MIFTVPSAYVFTTPFWSTDAVFGSDDSHFKVFNVGFAGFKAVFIFTVVPGSAFFAEAVRDIFLIFVILFVTFILHTAFLPLPSLATAIIFAVPFFFAVTLPEADTVATDLLEVFHFTVRFLASFGRQTAFSFTVFFGFNT